MNTHGKRRAAIAGVALAAGGALLLSACGGGGNDAGASTMYGGSGPTTSAPARATADVTATTNAKVGQPQLVDAHGRSIYLFVPDGTSTTSNVPAQFKPNWPPVTSATTPVAGSGLDATKMAAHTQPDGTNQLAYNGHLLYLYAGDHAPGDINGQGLGPNNWFLVSPAGNPIGQSMTTTTPSTVR